MHPNVRRDLALFPVSRGSYFQPPIPMIAFRSRRIPVLKPDRMGARMRIIALLLAFVLTGCTGNRLNAQTKPTTVALHSPPTPPPLPPAHLAPTPLTPPPQPP